MERKFARNICGGLPDYNGAWCRGIDKKNMYTDAACVKAMGAWYTDPFVMPGAVWEADCRNSTLV